MLSPESVAKTYESLFSSLMSLPEDQQELFIAKLLLLCACELSPEVLNNLIAKARNSGSNSNLLLG